MKRQEKTKVNSTNIHIKYLIITFLVILLIYPLTKAAFNITRSYYNIKTMDADCIPEFGDSSFKICIYLKNMERMGYLSKYKTLEDCKLAEKKNLCVFLIARITQNVTICETNLEGFNQKELCIYNMALYLRNSSECLKVTDICRTECELNIKSVKEADAQHSSFVYGNYACNTDESETFCAFRNC